MTYNLDFSIATSNQIEKALCKNLEKIRLSRNITQAQLADEAGVVLRTIGRLEKGAGVSFDTFIRVLIALRIQHNLEALLPDPSVRPVERLDSGGTERKRASSSKPSIDSKAWSWGDEHSDGDK